MALFFPADIGFVTHKTWYYKPHYPVRAPATNIGLMSGLWILLMRLCDLEPISRVSSDSDIMPACS